MSIRFPLRFYQIHHHLISTTGVLLEYKSKWIYVYHCISYIYNRNCDIKYNSTLLQTFFTVRSSSLVYIVCLELKIVVGSCFLWSQGTSLLTQILTSSSIYILLGPRRKSRFFILSRGWFWMYLSPCNFPVSSVDFLEGDRFRPR